MTQPTPPPAGPRASDPAVLTDGTVVPREVPAPARGGSFTVDLENAPQAIRELSSARDQLREIKKQAVALGRVDPPAADQVSRDAALILGAAATGGRGSLVEAVDAGIERLSQYVSALEAELRTYRGADRAAVDRFGDATLA